MQISLPIIFFNSLCYVTPWLMLECLLLFSDVYERLLPPLKKQKSVSSQEAETQKSKTFGSVESIGSTEVIGSNAKCFGTPSERALDEDDNSAAYFFRGSCKWFTPSSPRGDSLLQMSYRLKFVEVFAGFLNCCSAAYFGRCRDDLILRCSVC